MRFPVLTVALTVLIFGVTLRATVALYAVDGPSMEPTLPEGRVVLVNRLAFLVRSPRPGDIVVLQHPRDGTLLIKRLERTIDRDRYFVRGDNAVHSIDSRHFGAVPGSYIRGRVFFVGSP